MFHSDEELFQHIKDEIVFLKNDSQNTELNQFLESEIKQRAYSRSIEIIGEAVKNISNETIVQYPNIPWRKIAGMRDKLIHGYFSVNYKIVWDVIRNVIPDFEKQIDLIIDKKKNG